MYGLAEDADLSFFKGAFLEQVCLGANQVILNFDQGVSISSACWVALAVGEHRIESDERFRTEPVPPARPGRP